MSTKIYTGFRFLTSDWAEAHRHVMDFREKLGPAAQRDRLTRLAEEAVTYLDRKRLGIEKADGDQDPWTYARQVIEKEEQDDPASLELALFPHEGRIYGMSFGRNAYVEAWDAMPFVEEFRYWNNTDRPEGLGRDEWDARRTTWAAILGDRSAEMAGFTARCVPAHLGPMSAYRAQLLFPGLEARSRVAAMDFLFWDYRKGRDMGNGTWKVYLQFRRWLNTPEGKAAHDAEADRIRPLLSPSVTPEMLLGLPEATVPPA